MLDFSSHTITNPRDNFNKDRFLIKDNWFVVTDGISSKGENGAKAAQLACDVINETNLEDMTSSKDLKSLLTDLSSQIRNFSGGTTLTSIFIKNDNLILSHVGDSECYIITHDKEIKEITIPTTLAYAHYKQGLVELKDVKTAYYSNVLVSYLGSSKLDLNIQIEKIPLKNVAYVILCTDGANIVSIEKIKELVLNNFENSAKEIACLAAEKGSRDDITVLAVKFAHVV